MANHILEERHRSQVEVGARIKRARVIRSKSQSSVAEWLGLSQSQLSKLERGEREISFHDLGRLAVSFGLPLQWFIDGRYSTRGGRQGLEQELRAYGIVDLNFATAGEPVGAFRTVEEVLCQALPGQSDPRLLEALPILLLLHPVRSDLLLGFARRLQVLRTAAFLCDVALHLHASAPWPSPSPLEFDEVEVISFLDEAKDSLARRPERPAERVATSNRLAKQWKVAVAISMKDFEARCVSLAAEVRR